MTDNRQQLLAIERVYAGYGSTTILRDINFGVDAGTVTAVIGPNGAGKTTLLRVLAGLIKPSQGEITIRGKTVTRQRPLERAKAGLCLIPEGRGVFPRLTVAENLRLQIPPWNRDASIDAALSAFPALRTRLSTVAGSLSGGQQQQLALCRCYLASPDLIMLDELSMGLAPKVIDEIFDSLQILTERGVAMLIVEQYVQRVLSVANRVILLNRGVIVFDKRPDEIDEASLIRDYLGAGGADSEDPGELPHSAVGEELRIK